MDCEFCGAKPGAMHDVTCLMMPPAELQARAVEWARAAFPNDTPELRALGVGEESGELLRAFLKRANGIRGTRAEWDREIRKEMGDVVTTCFILAAYENFDLWDAVIRRFAVVSTRDINHDPVDALEDPDQVSPRRFRRLVEEVRATTGEHAVVGVCPHCDTGLVTYVDEDSTRVRCPSCGWEGWDEQILGNPRTGEDQPTKCPNCRSDAPHVRRWTPPCANAWHDQ